MFCFFIVTLHTYYFFDCMQVVGPTAYKKAMYAEIDRVARLKNTGVKGRWKLAGKDLEGGAYQAKYPDTWKMHLKKSLASGANAIVCVTELMNHVVHYGNILFADTIYKDTW